MIEHYHSLALLPLLYAAFRLARYGRDYGDAYARRKREALRNEVMAHEAAERVVARRYTTADARAYEVRVREAA